MEENARKEAKEETNLEVILEGEEKPFLVLSAPDRDPRTHMVTVVYLAKGYGTLEEGSDAKQAELYTPMELSDLFGKNSFAFDHEKIIKDYLKYRGILE
ncbi:NUDIX hydrolase [Candidatus Woesearchaeota archaeon]|nr:NUDIX hydrolase [Candidatus Woesearchaeota archaeon]